MPEKRPKWNKGFWDSVLNIMFALIWDIINNTSDTLKTCVIFSYHSHKQWNKGWFLKVVVVWDTIVRQIWPDLSNKTKWLDNGITIVVWSLLNSFHKKWYSSHGKILFLKDYFTHFYWAKLAVEGTKDIKLSKGECDHSETQCLLCPDQSEWSECLLKPGRSMIIGKLVVNNS